MENEENVDVQEEVVEQEEQLEVEVEEEAEESEETEDDSISVSKAEFNDYQKYLEKKKQRQEFAKKAEQKTNLSTKPQGQDKGLSLKLERIELRQEGYTSDEVDAIMELGGSKVLESKLVQSAIKQMRADKKSKEADSTFSAKSPVYKKHTMDELKGMSSAELEKILPHA